MTGNNNKAGFSLPSSGAECEVKPVDKPTELHTAIRQMQYLSERLDGLYERINSSSPVTDGEVKEDRDKDVCLLEVLNESPRIVRQHLEYQHQRIIDIEQSIFNH
tara:strand:- start:198 stop:512 length:315 start_codon:yes stop_codon:yes gene_type:complete